MTSAPKVTIRAPTADELPSVYALRHKILREPWNQPNGSERSPEDETQTHLALFEDDKLVATARLDGLGNGLAQIRCVAVDNGCQGKGYGNALMKETEVVAMELGFTDLTLHARVNAVMFYHRLGFSFVGPSYYLWEQIQHYEMRKSLKPNVDKSDMDQVFEQDGEFLQTVLNMVEKRGLSATKSLFDLFLTEAARKVPNADRTIETTPTNDGKLIEAPKN
jgi:ribosomal protein S18 acetylase RimI-like enzyme